MNSLPDLSVPVSKLPNSGRHIIFDADAADLQEISSEIGVEKVSEFAAKLLARPWNKGGMALKGELVVNLEQACVVTSEPVPATLNVNIDRKYLPVGKTIRREKTNEDGELVIDPDASDLPDEFSGDTINLWEAILEEIVLELDPFPRTPNAEISVEYLPEDDANSAAEQTHSPFAELNALINKKNSEN
ncbi:MAG: DUF177 domain-containing protein [Rhizobiaceae bacterium]|nr:DUF177 domain-containing protein [Rhizobiaceae bacterium]